MHELEYFSLKRFLYTKIETLHSYKIGTPILDMRIRVQNVEYELGGGDVRSGGVVRPFRVSFDTGDRYFRLKLSATGSLYVNNEGRFSDKRKGKMRYSDDPGLNDGSLLSNPYLELKLSDFSPHEEMTAHWKSVRSHFVEDKDSSEPIRGKSLDRRFPSEGCLYVDGHPWEQHYKHGRHHYYLRKDGLLIEDTKTIQLLEREQPETVLELMKFIAAARPPREALESIRMRRWKMSSAETLSLGVGSRLVS
ncbi:MAG: hypothetical protein HY369_05545 [Candidatus Aenigmarchaeota archaeon]|nr:hypothetical protein [Candidatus Aenigmarchaeota archaeon]